MLAADGRGLQIKIPRSPKSSNRTIMSLKRNNIIDSLSPIPVQGLYSKWYLDKKKRKSSRPHSFRHPQARKIKHPSSRPVPFLHPHIQLTTYIATFTTIQTAFASLAAQPTTTKGCQTIKKIVRLIRNNRRKKRRGRDWGGEG